jgi:acetyl-CoA acetyltransferases
MAGAMDVIVAGGVEMMSSISMNFPEEFQDKKLVEQIPASYMAMGITAENVAEQYNVSRADMEIMATESHQKAAAAQAAGKFDEEIIPVTIDTEDGPVIVTKDEGVRPGTNPETLATMAPCFKDDGIVTAATSSQMTDGAAFVLMMSEEKAEELGLKPIAVFRGFAVGGVAASVMGIGPIVAIPKVMEKSGLSIADMDVIELNEAFAAQALACIRVLDLPMEKVNPNGGAMALGHPLGGTGAVLVCKALSELKRSGGRYGLISMCIGGGMGAAGIFELV